MNKIIYRVDDRFIHGQVLEGWVNYYHITNIIIVNDLIAEDSMRALIYKSALPAGVKFSVYSVADFLRKKPYLKVKKQHLLVIVGSVSDLFKISSILNSGVYINVGCVTTANHDICITDSVFLSMDELNLLKMLSGSNDIYFHKVPWEKPVIFSKETG